VVKPVIQFGTSIDGKSMTGSGPNACHKLLAFAHSLSIPRGKGFELLQENGVLFPTDSNKQAHPEQCGKRHIDILRTAFSDGMEFKNNCA